MYTAQTKKISIIAILNILNKYSDQEHRLSQKDIMNYLKVDYGLNIERKAIKRNLMDLMDFGYEIEYTPTSKINTQGEEEIISSDWYIEHKFDNSELRLLIDSLLFSKHIPYSQCKELINKLIELSSIHFRANVQHVHNLPDTLPLNPELMLTVELIDEAIQNKRKIVFNYTEYGMDKKKRLTTKENGDVIEYRINPYQMVATNGHYYLICGLEELDGLMHMRVDRIVNVKILDMKARPPRERIGGKTGLNLPKHMAEHIYMYAGKSIRVTFLAHHNKMQDIVDWFGLDFDITKIDEETIEVNVLVNEMAMYRWALQYGNWVEVLSPKSLREELELTTVKMAEKYAKHATSPKAQL